MTDALVLDPKRTALVLIDLQRGIMGATNFGVESTAKGGYERGYAFVCAEDAMASSPGAHEFAVTTIFPRLGRVRSSDEIMQALRSEPAR
jgi:nicotinamidase-related amidase